MFCFSIYRVRRVLKWTEHTVKFMERFEFVFNEKDSLSKDYPIQVVNFPIVVLKFCVAYFKYFNCDFLGSCSYC